MKKLIFVLGLLAFFAIACNPHQASAQERTVNITVAPGNTYYNYTGSAADTLKATTQDTIDVVFFFRIDQYVQKIAVKTRFDVIAGADTTVSVSVFGKEFYDDATYVEVIAAATSSAVTANNTIQVLTSDPYTVEANYVTGRVQAGDTINVSHNLTPFDKSYRYYRVRYIIKGDDSVGTGILIDDIEFKIYTD